MTWLLEHRKLVLSLIFSVHVAIKLVSLRWSSALKWLADTMWWQTLLETQSLKKALENSLKSMTKVNSRWASYLKQRYSLQKNSKSVVLLGNVLLLSKLIVLMPLIKKLVMVRLINGILVELIEVSLLLSTLISSVIPPSSNTKKFICNSRHLTNMSQDKSACVWPQFKDLCQPQKTCKKSPMDSIKILPQF